MESRRKFIKKSAIAGAGLPLLGSSIFNSEDALKKTAAKCPVCLFSKHLQFLENYDDLADALVEIGVDGVDLSVRSGGHVEPENVETDLPKAVEAIQKKGLIVPMMVSGINDPEDPLTERVLKTASELGIKIYRMGYLRYGDPPDVKKNLKKFRQTLEGLAELNKKYDIQGAYQNHAGKNFGSPVWDLWDSLKGLDPEWSGCQYDIRHAIIEGFNSWVLDFDLIRPFMKCTAVKDASWEQSKGKWRSVNVPLGEGFVELDAYFELLRSTEFSGPVTMHAEYELYDKSDKTITVEQMRTQAVSALRKDVDFLRQKLTASGLV